MDLWRVSPDGGSPERLTTHNSDVAYPTPIDSRTVVYVPHDEDGSGPWLWAIDVDRKLTRRVSFGVEKYLSVAATPDGSQLAATVANPSASLWSVPIFLIAWQRKRTSSPFACRQRTRVHRDSAPAPCSICLRSAPEMVCGDSMMASPRKSGRVPTVPCFRRPTFRATGRKWRSSCDAAESSDCMSCPPRVVSSGALADSIDVRGAASWSPDGKWIVVRGNEDGSPGLFKIPADGGKPIRLTTGVALNPVWSPDGNVIAYAGPNVSSLAPLLAIRPDGAPVRLSEIKLRRDGERLRFAPDGSLIYMQGELRAQNFWRLDLATMTARPLTPCSHAMRCARST